VTFLYRYNPEIPLPDRKGIPIITSLKNKNNDKALSKNLYPIISIKLSSANNKKFEQCQDYFVNVSDLTDHAFNA